MKEIRSRATEISAAIHSDHCCQRFDLLYSMSLYLNVGLTLVQRLRRWTNVKPTLIQRTGVARNAIDFSIKETRKFIGFRTLY